VQAEKLDFEKVTAGLKTKSDKIRALSRHGVPTADIARYLDIRYQHARNVLRAAGLHKARDAASPAATPTRSLAWVELGSDGSLTIPAGLLAKAELTPEKVQVRLTDDGLEILSQKAALARAQAIVARHVPPGVSLVDEFIAERRREAAREDRGE
jgi:hypothetical protein